MSTGRRFDGVPLLVSPLVGVESRAWSRFATAMEVQPVQACSPSGGLGAYDMRPGRLVELGYAKKEKQRRTDAGRQVQACSFVGKWSREKFLAHPVEQYTAFSRSMRLYHDALREGKPIRLPAGLSMAEALALLHRGGRGALEAWPEKVFPATAKLLARVRGCF
jgi:hypothetical protein